MVFRFVLFSGLCLILSCTSQKAVYRPLAPDDPVCATELDLGPGNLEPSRANDNPARCFVQSHRLPIPDPGPDGPADWAAVAASVGRDLTEPSRYTLAFVEMSDADALHRPDQLAALRDHLEVTRAAGRQHYVMVFVHGWRHDASLRDGDVRKFRILLGYARAALNTRCVMRAEYCDAALTGVFVGWRGRSFAEPVLVADGQFSPFSVLAAPTLWDRKAKSDALGRGVPLGQVMETVQGALRLDPGRASADKMLVFGHSLGGNMLAELMQGRMLRAIDAHAGGAEMRPPLGDLVVLINPAAEATKWTGLQQAMRAKAGMPPDDNRITARVDGEIDWTLWAQKLRPWRAMFPMTQRPVYVSITATGNWAGIETGGRPIAYDSATGFLFPLAQSLAGVEAEEDKRTIGHLAPLYLDQRTLISRAEGTSHELSVNQGTGQRANYRLSAVPQVSWCDPANGWLLAVREDQKAVGWSFGDGWDYGLSPDEAELRLTAAENIARGINPASVQWRHSMNLSGQPNMWSVVSGRSPVWNVRALDTAVREHAGYVNYPMWCAIQQLVLDDVTARRRVDPTVMAVQAEEDRIDATATE